MVNIEVQTLVGLSQTYVTDVFERFDTTDSHRCSMCPSRGQILIKFLITLRLNINLQIFIDILLIFRLIITL